MRRLSAQTIVMAGLLVAWLGAWGTWLAHPTAGLTQTALSLAQVAQRLPDVLYGDSGSIPELLYASLGLTVLAVSVAAVGLRARAIGWLVRALALLLAVRLLPPFPDVRELWRSPAYGDQFIVAVLVLVGWAATLSSGRWSKRTQNILTSVLALAALVLGLVSYVVLQRAFARTTELVYTPGWGLGLYTVGLASAIGVGLAKLIVHLRQMRADVS